MFMFFTKYFFTPKSINMKITIRGDMNKRILNYDSGAVVNNIRVLYIYIKY